MKTSRQIQAVIFDFDNTLVHTNIDFDAIRASLFQLAKDKGVKLPVKERYAISEIMIEIYHQAANITDQAEAIISKFETEGIEGSTVAKSASELLQELSSMQITIGVFTNNIRNTALTLLRDFDLLRNFDEDFILCRDELPWKRIKPSGYGLKLLLGRMNTYPGNTCLVGDSWVDAKCAEEAGVNFIGVGPKAKEIESRLLSIGYAADLSEVKDLLLR